MNDRHWMRQALRLAADAALLDEVPVGAVLVSAKGEFLGAAHNRVRTDCDPSAHAEVLCIREAAGSLGNYRLEGCTLYVTLEPCPMCAGLLVHARIHRLVFAARDFKTGAAGSVCNLLCGAPLNHAIQIDEGIFQTEAATLLEDFFRACRAREAVFMPSAVTVDAK
ncbi:nucleoside deaminase [Legionella geestiana]|uniref:tRNA adenosine(34) deaminase TadA n=1 Tax=Legionella geestiana TaxID=45065 RepID=UPI0010923304|nr:tRNA adenosine(34) deaminase TadA [Legionella geestiana]QDQ40579.1 nucleoside deaminase [Legionella geestiana]